MNEYILIVEDEAVLYRRMKKILKKEAFEIADYTPSVAEALQKINQKKPDLVLLDIKLQGEATGIDLGKMLYHDYKIPFIYVTDYDNEMFFAKALETHHEHYLVKTKPSLNAGELKRAIYTALQRHKEKMPQPKSDTQKLGISGLVNYLDIIKNFSHNNLTRKTVLFDDIAFFTSDIKYLMAHNNDFRKNYIWFITKNGDIYYLKTSLKKLKNILPDNFVRVNDAYIINLSPKMFDGRINNQKISVNNEIISIGDAYKDDFNEAFNRFYFS